VRTPAVIGDPTPWTTGMDGEPLRLAPGGFAQAHGEVNRALGLWVTKHAGSGPEKTKLVELHAGSGNLTVGLAKIAQVSAVESDALAADAARANLAARGLVAKVVCADADSYAMAGDTQTVVLDPPRTGAKTICEALAKSRVKKIVYVSCDPPSLKRDLAFLRERFTVRAAAMFEMFPHTSHVESAVVLTREKK
jgi:23S rRNA (uracil1939-C5)-methyltransferase